MTLGEASVRVSTNSQIVNKKMFVLFLSSFEQTAVSKTQAGVKSQHTSLPNPGVGGYR